MDEIEGAARRRKFDVDDEGDDHTVRILPDDGPGDLGGDESGAQPLRRGTLYTPAPAPQPRPVPRGIYEPYEPARPAAASRRTHIAAEQTALARTTDSRLAEEVSPSSRPEVVKVRRGPSACLVLATTFSLLLLACGLLAFATLQGGLNGLGKLTGIIPSFGFTLVSTPTVTIDVSRPTVIDQVRALSKLETVHYQMEKVVSGKSSGPLPDWLTSDKILLVAHGEVVGGVDLSLLKAGDIMVVSDTVTITMPSSEVLYSKLDNDKTYVYDRQTGVFSKPDPNLETDLRRVAEQQITQAAIEDGIMDKSRQNAEQVLRTLVTGLGYKRVVFNEK